MLLEVLMLLKGAGLVGLLALCFYGISLAYKRISAMVLGS